MKRTHTRHLTAKLAGGAAALGLLVAACSGGTGGGATASDPWAEVAIVGGDVDLVPIIVSSDLAAGEPSRFLFSLLDGDGNVLSSPDVVTPPTVTSSTSAKATPTPAPT